MEELEELPMSSFSNFIKKKQENLLDIPVDTYASSHPQRNLFQLGHRDFHYICLLVCNVTGLPNTLRAKLKKNLCRIVYDFYYTPSECWYFCWQNLHETLVDLLPEPNDDAPSWALEISNIVKNKKLQPDNSTNMCTVKLGK